jgi:hypothetical protein
MNTYFSKNLQQKSLEDQFEVIRELEKLPENTLATIQWNISDDTLYGVSSLDPSVVNPSDEGLIWHYEKAGKLLNSILSQLNS